MDTNELLSRFWEAFSIPVQWFDGDQLIMPYGRHDFSPCPALYHINSYLDTPHSVVFLTSADYLMVGMVKIAGTSQYLVVGPATPYKFSRTNILNVLQTMKLPEERLNELQITFHHYPQIGQHNFRESLSFLSYILNETSEDESIRISYKPTANFNDIHTQTIEPVYEGEFMLEKVMLDFIRYGRSTELKDTINQVYSSAMSVANLGGDAIRSIKNTGIGSVAICARAAMDGGLSYNSAMTLTDYYIASIESLTTYNEISEFIMTMILDFAQRTERIQAPADLPSRTKDVYQYIDEHIYSKIALADIADNIGFSHTHLSHFFKRETGITVTDYIHQRKIREACYLLNTTDLSIADISNQLSFSSQQHFHRIFKQKMGVTPGQYVHNQSLKGS